MHNKTAALTRYLLLATCAIQFAIVSFHTIAEEIDPSDPTKIYSYAGGGVKYTDYTNGESMTELRAIGNLGLSASDMVLFETGYGHHSGDSVPGSNDGMTNSRLRWFHLFPMEQKVSGYRGMGTQVDLQLAGQLKGTNGQNVLSLGGVGAFGINEMWNAYLALNIWSIAGIRDSITTTAPASASRR